MTTSEPYTYFQPGEMLFLLTRNTDPPIDIQIDNFDLLMNEVWIPFVDEVVKAHDPNLAITRRKDRELHFAGTLERPVPPRLGIDYSGSVQGSLDSKRRGAFSLIPVEVGLLSGEAAECPQLVELIDYLEHPDQHTALQKSLNGGVYPGATAVDTILLNWLASPASECGGGGGPGGRPEPFEEVSGKAPIYRFQIPSLEPFLEAEDCQQGGGVTVAILDTAPNTHDMAAVYERYHKLYPRNRIESHGLSESLLRPNGPFHVHPASLEELLRMRAVHIRDHNYEMSDHGLFIAGIIHTIAPKAEIHLYEVLNPYGVGDISSIAHGLWEVLGSFQGRCLVVNCSFMLTIPLLDHPITDLDSKILKMAGMGSEEQPDNGYLTTERFACCSAWLARQGKVIEWICDQFLWQGARVVAAAGNDWRPNQRRPQARFPAAFQSVFGVGALPKDAQPNTKDQYSPASYSNLSDVPDPEGCGVLTLGGEAGKNNGILGIYLGKFPRMEFLLQQYPELLRPLLRPILALRWGSPSGPKNENNWAWWSGTSFAAPIVTGLIAVAFSDIDKPAVADDAIGSLYAMKVIRPAVTDSGEDGIVDVRQA